MSDGSTGRRSPLTLIAQAGHFIDNETGAVVPPIEPATTFARDKEYRLPGGFIYSRNGAPTVSRLEALICELEGGAQSLMFSSGMSAVAAIVDTLQEGQRIAAPSIMYHGVKTWLLRQQDKRGIGIDLFDARESGSIAAVVRPGQTKIVWLETPANPTWDVMDIQEAAGIAHSAGAELVVDSTCAPPVTTRPLEHGADISFHSATKYLNGHSDVTAGVITARAISPRWQEIEALRVPHGTILAPFEAWLLLRGMRTLAIRFERASRNALEIARHFKGHPKLDAVLYPGLESHPGHDVAARQMTDGFGGMLSLLVSGGVDETRRFVTSLRMIIPATSLGGVETLAEHRYVVEGPHSIVPKNLVRISVGIEAADDLISDIAQALETV